MSHAADQAALRKAARDRCEAWGKPRVDQLVQMGGQIPAQWMGFVAEWQAEQEVKEQRRRRRIEYATLTFGAIAALFSIISAIEGWHQIR